MTDTESLHIRRRSQWSGLLLFPCLLSGDSSVPSVSNLSQTCWEGEYEDRCCTKLYSLRRPEVMSFPSSEKRQWSATASLLFLQQDSCWQVKMSTLSKWSLWQDFCLVTQQVSCHILQTPYVFTTYTHHACFMWPAGLGMNTHLIYLGEISPRKIRGIVTLTSATFTSLGKVSGRAFGLR